MSNRRYYWLKLKNDFFEDDTIKWLEEQENGKDYVIFYLKLALKSLTDNGSLIRYVGEKLIPYDVKALSRLTDTPVDTVAVAMKTFEQIGLITVSEIGEIYLNQINEMIGSETESAKRVRKHRLKKALNSAENEQALLCNNDVTKSNTDIRDKSLELDIDLDKDNMSVAPTIPYLEIINYLNQVAGRNFRSVESTRKLIRARFNEGFTLDDFKRVIGIKCKDWLGDPKMEIYLRPQTLFGTKFEGYLNQKTSSKQSNQDEWLEITHQLRQENEYE